MSKTNQLWQDELEEVLNASTRGELSLVTTVKRLKALGLDGNDLQEHLDIILERANLR